MQKRPAGRAQVTGFWSTGCAVLVALLACCPPLGAKAQAANLVSFERTSEEPGSAAVSASSSAEASVSGTIVDTDEAAIPAAQITLHRVGESAALHVVSEQDGTFSSQPLPPGEYELRVERSGFQSWTGRATIGRAAPTALGEIALKIAAAETVEVRASGHDIAEAQLQLEEQQRVLGVFPNFYASYAAHPEPLSAGEKFRLAWRFSADPVVFAVAGMTALSEQRAGTFPGYGPGARGYSRRFGAAYTDGLTSTLLGEAALPALLHQDPRYFVKGTGSVPSRFLYALASTVRCKGDSGHWQVNYSNVLGNLGSAGISNTYYPAASRGVGLVVQNAMTATALGAVGGLFQEFLLHRMTPHVPEYDNTGL